MPGIQVQGSNMKERMEQETQQDRQKIFACHTLQLIFVIVPTICWGIWMVNANNIDSGFTDLCESFKD